MARIPKNTPQYTLQLSTGQYLSERQPMIGMSVTTNISEAMKYHVGYDNQEHKLGYWDCHAKKIGQAFQILPL